MFWLWQWTKTAGTNFGEVEAGRIYRSAAPSASDLRRYVTEYQLRTVLDLRDDVVPPPPPIDGVAFRRIPLDDHGPVDVASVEAAVAMLADHSAQPILLHCEGGRHRTGLVVAVYRVRYCGWTGEEARREADRFGMYRYRHDELYDYTMSLE